MAAGFCLPDGWKEWIATNLLLGQSEGTLLDVLISKGFSAELSRLEIRAAACHPYLSAAQSIARQRVKRDWILHTQRVLKNSCSNSIVERRNSLSSEEFFRHFYSQNRPVIITDVIQRWPAFQKWNQNYLKATIGSQSVEIQNGRTTDANYERNSRQHREAVPFSDFVDTVFRDEISNDCYMTANNADANSDVVLPLWNDIDGLEEYLLPAPQKGSRFFWMGPKGTVTPLHHDLTNNFMAQIVGQKKVKLISPEHLPLMYNDCHCYSAVDLDKVDFDRYPDFRHVRAEEIILEPGDLFFLPVGWWHHVTGLSPTITLTFTHFRWINRFTDFYSTYAAI